jgi:predicted transcriptional regulator
MQKTLTVSIPAQIRIKLDRVSKRDNLPKGAIVGDALRRYFAQQEFQELRQMVIPRAQKQGFFTDEEVFKAVS